MDTNIPETPLVKSPILNWKISGLGFVFILIFITYINPIIQIFLVLSEDKYLTLINSILDIGISLIIGLLVGFFVKTYSFLNGLFLGLTTAIVALFIAIPSSQIGIFTFIQLLSSITLPVIIGCTIGGWISGSKYIKSMLFSSIAIIFLIIIGSSYYLISIDADTKTELQTTETDPTPENSTKEDAIIVLNKHENADNTWPIFVSEKHGFQINLPEDYQPNEVEDGLTTTEIRLGQVLKNQYGIKIEVSLNSIDNVKSEIESKYSSVGEEEAIKLNNLAGIKLSFKIDSYPYHDIYHLINTGNKTYIINSHNKSDELIISTFQTISSSNNIKR